MTTLCANSALPAVDFEQTVGLVYRIRPFADEVKRLRAADKRAFAETDAPGAAREQIDAAIRVAEKLGRAVLVQAERVERIRRRHSIVPVNTVSICARTFFPLTVNCEPTTTGGPLSPNGMSLSEPSPSGRVSGTGVAIGFV